MPTTLQRSVRIMFTPHTPQEVEEMLKVIGLRQSKSFSTRFRRNFRFPELNIPEGLSEMEIASELKEIASANATTDEFVSFLGAGAYNHYIPAAVDMILRRGEFYTAYTPYQPEVSQGTLQAIFEFQSLMTELTGMDVSNASHYDAPRQPPRPPTWPIISSAGNERKSWSRVP